MKALATHLKTLLARLDALSVRERLLVFAAVAGGLLTLFVYVLITPAIAREERYTTEAYALGEEARQLRVRLAALAQTGVPGDHGQGALTVYEAKLAANADLIETVRRLVQAHPRVHLAALFLQPPQPLLAVTEPADAAALGEGQADTATPTPGSAANPPWYAHGISLELEGSYADLSETVRALEQLPGLIEWRQLRLDGQSHPRIRLQLEFAVLRKEATWRNR